MRTDEMEATGTANDRRALSKGCISFELYSGCNDWGGRRKG